MGKAIKMNVETKKGRKRGQGRKVEYVGGIMNFATTIPKESKPEVLAFVEKQRKKYKLKKVSKKD